MNTIVHPFDQDFSLNQLNFLKKTRLPEISCFQIDEKESFLAFEAFKEIKISYKNQAWVNSSQVLSITKGKIFHLAKIRGKNRDVRLIYEDDLNSYNIFIPWKNYLELKRKGYIVAYDVYAH